MVNMVTLYLLNISMLGSIVILRLLAKTKEKKINLPVHLDRLSFQTPVEEQNSTPVPFRENPSLQVKRHWEPKLKFPRGWEQFIDRGEGKARMALH